MIMPIPQPITPPRRILWILTSFSPHLSVLVELLSVLLSAVFWHIVGKKLIQRTHENDLQIMRIGEFNKAGNDLCASFAPQLAYLRGYEGSIADTETIRQKLYSAFVDIHSAELQRFRFYVKSKDIEDYDKAYERYEEKLHPGLICKPKDQEPSEFFIAQIQTLIEFTNRFWIHTSLFF